MTSVTPEPTCAFACHAGDSLTVRATGVFARASATCGGASAHCQGLFRCTATSSSPAVEADAEGQCVGVSEVLIRCNAHA